VAVEQGALGVEVGANPALFSTVVHGCRLKVTGTHTASGLRVSLCLDDLKVCADVPVIGQFNVENIAVVAGILLAQGHELSAIANALECITPPPGRMTPVTDSNAPLLVVDYAHTPDALEKVLNALRPLAVQREGQLVCLFGCGGDRDAGKRPLMAAIAQRLSDSVYVTSDNPRTEDAQEILADICKGFSKESPVKITLEADRSRAIAMAVGASCMGDVVLLAGKGHETGQIVGDQVLPFSDLEHANAALRRWALNAEGQA
jgi:UDP-N-acetylmuramoyl-L-alanyl-D-glutamate--2,6-diaminopimelate ligase